MANRPKAQPDSRRVRDRSIVLLVVGIALLLPPLAGASLVEGRVLGVPVPLLYILVVWAGLILGTARLARPLWDSQRGEDTPPPPGNGSGNGSENTPGNGVP